MNSLIRSALVLTAAITIAVGSAAAQEIDGIAEVRSGNEIRVDDTIIRLYGSSAPGPDEACDSGERRFRCGVIAWAELIRLADGHKVSCDIEDQHAPAGTSYATCYVGERDVNEALVRSGWAEAAQGVERYRVDQEDARRARRGLWAGRIRPPDRRQAP
ncbi:MAG: thermonuclease family protein [Alphaproteobacteria bacterium]|nr:thermonuclease family protein [Alphaproteobacteria bacterium]